MRKLVVTTLLLALAAPAPALAALREVKIPGNRYDPATRLVLPGETVRWTNNDRQVHTVSPRPGSGVQDSGDIAAGLTFDQTFAAVGDHRYYCKRHVFMSGTIVVRDLHLSGPVGTLNHGAEGRFTGLAREGQEVVLRRADGSVVATTTASAADGSFSIRIPAVAPGRYHATAGTVQSAPVTVRVKPKLALTSKRSGTRLILTLKATPSQAGAPVVVQRLQRSRWVKIAGGRLNATSKATFRVARKAMKIRARTTRGVGGYAVATSRTLGVR